MAPVFDRFFSLNFFLSFFLSFDDPWLCCSEFYSWGWSCISFDLYDYLDCLEAEISSTWASIFKSCSFSAIIRLSLSFERASYSSYPEEISSSFYSSTSFYTSCMFESATSRSGVWSKVSIWVAAASSYYSLLLIELLSSYALSYSCNIF